MDGLHASGILNFLTNEAAEVIDMSSESETMLLGVQGDKTGGLPGEPKRSLGGGLLGVRGDKRGVELASKLEVSGG